MTELVRKLRCAVYTRKSTDEGLDQDFNSLDAQREACEAFVASQRHEGWVLLPQAYDDGAYSGANLERPGLKQLLANIAAGKVDIVVIYKVDRLTRSLLDFAKLVEVFDAHKVTFYSVTQHFNTTTSMGRLTLNVLLSFAQFEREVSAERIRDKVAASRRRGIFMGGQPPLGYDVRDRKLVINPDEAHRVRRIYQRFPQLRSLVALMRELNAAGLHTKAWTTVGGKVHLGHPFDKPMLRRILTNRVYLGEAVHKGTAYPGEHEAIITREAWDAVQSLFKERPHKRAATSRANTPFLLKGLVFVKETGRAMVPTFTKKRGKHYRYYVAVDALKRSAQDCSVRRVAAGRIEALVLRHIRRAIRAPEMIAKTWFAAHAEDRSIKEQEVRDALIQFDHLWEELFPAEQARIAQLMVERIDVDPEGFDLHLRLEGLSTIIDQLKAAAPAGEKAA